MWKEIFNAFRHTDVVDTLEGMVGEMLDTGEWMFQQVSDLLERKVQADDIRDALYEKDRRINQLEQVIREKIVTHLSLDNPQDLGPCLVLMSVVKDAERIGDYCKNIFEVGKFYEGLFHRPEFYKPLEEIASTIRGMFERTKKAMIENDTSLAKLGIAKKSDVSKGCNMLVQQLLSITDKDMPAAEAVAYALLARYYKRGDSHLSNLASSVVSPVPLRDFQGKIE